MNMTKSRSGLVAVCRSLLKRKELGTEDHHAIESDLSPLRVTQLPLSTDSPLNRSVPSDDDEMNAS